MKEQWVWRYELQAAGALNAATARMSYRGALIFDGKGYGCVQPWPELGDRELEVILADLGECELSKRSLFCQEMDGKARLAGQWLFDGVKVPRSHGLVVREQVPEGFDVYKIKARLQNLEWVREFCEGAKEGAVRLDFNGTGRPGMFDDWSERALRTVEFVEDPYPPELGDWAALPVPTANDFFEGGGEFRVVKPAVQMMNGELGKVVVTSYLDHPVGQAFAAFEAGRAGIQRVCGLQTHGVFEVDEFTEALGPVGPEFSPPEGTGLGFDEFLEKLPWVKL